LDPLVLNKACSWPHYSRLIILFSKLMSHYHLTRMTISNRKFVGYSTCGGERITPAAKVGLEGQAQRGIFVGQTANRSIEERTPSVGLIVLITLSTSALRTHGFV